MRARFRALLLSTVMLLTATSFAAAAFDSDCFPELSAAPTASAAASTMPLDHLAVLRGTVGPTADASDTTGEMPVVATADLVIALPDDLGSEVAQALASWTAPAADSKTAAAGANLALTTAEPQAPGSLIATAAPADEPSESTVIPALALE